MRTPRPFLLLALSTALVAPVAASAESGPTFGEQSVFFTCHGTDAEKVQNLAAATGWREQAPTRSVQQGAGCGFADAGALYNTDHASAAGAPEAGGFDPVFEGTFTGNLRSVTADLYVLGHSFETLAFGDTDLFVWLSVDGKSLYYGPDLVRVGAVPENDGRTQRVSFTLSGLDQFLPAEEGDGATEHVVTLSVAPWNREETIGWVWDTVEVPAGLTFNDTTPADVDVRVLPGDGG
jgi:hypothetical protein